MPRAQKQDWMTAEILELMDERMKMKNQTGEYELLDKKVRKMCREAKDNFYNKKCAEIEDLEKKPPNICMTRYGR